MYKTIGLVIVLQFFAQTLFSQCELTIRPDSTEGNDVTVWSLPCTAPYAVQTGVCKTTNFAEREYLSATAWTWSSTPAIKRSYLEFNLDSLASAGCSVISAKLVLQSVDNPTQYHCGSGSTIHPCTDNQLDISRVIEPWLEDTIVWDNQPQVTAGSSSTELLVIPNNDLPYVTYEMNITDMVNFWLQNPSSNYGLQLALSAESYYSGAHFSSSNHSDPNKRPMLILELNCPNSCANLIEGYIYDDANSNCILDAGETGLENWIVEIQPGPFSAISDSTGYYSAWVNSSDYTVSQAVPNTTIWNEICPVSFEHYVPAMSYGDVTSDLNFAVHADTYCPELTLDIGTGFFRKGHVSLMHVEYCNTGNLVATDVSVSLDFDQELTPLSSSIVWDSPQNGDNYEFTIGDLEPGECGEFTVEVQVGLNVEISQALCVEGIILPIYECTNGIDSEWDKSSVMVTGICSEDSLACFTILNTGDNGDGNMQGTSEYRIYENNVLVSVGTFQLDGQESIEICWPAYGNTIRLEADQRPFHPGNSNPNEVIEGCGVNSVGSFTTGNALDMPLDDDDLFVAIDCHEVIFSYDPNDKTPSPKGVDEQGYIGNSDELEYRIRFQNTGNDTAFTIVVIDTLSQFLNPATVVSGVSSHDYTFDMYGAGILKWTFNNIMLPDSNVNEVGSHGFVKFTIKQDPNNLIGDEITNKVGIYFDYNEAVMTNTTLNTIYEIDVVSTPSVYDEKYDVTVFPNPFFNAVNFNVSGLDAPFQLTVYDMAGHVVKVLNSTAAELILNRDNLESGIYFYTLTSNEKMVANGKVVAQ